MKKLPLIFTAALLGAALFPLSFAARRAQAAAREYFISEKDPVADLIALPAFSEAEREDFSLERVLDVAYGKVYRFRQQVEGKEIFGGEVTVSTGAEGKVLSVNGSYIAPRSVSEGKLSERAAEEIAEDRSGCVLSLKKTFFVANGTLLPAFEIYTGGQGGERLFLSAENGEILLSESVPALSLSTKQEDALGRTVDVEVEQMNGQYYLADFTRNIFTVDTNERNLTSRTQKFSDSMAVSVFYNAVKAYDFYTEDNIGANIRGIDGGHNEVYGDMAERGEIPLYLVIHDNRTAEDRDNASFYLDEQRGRAYLYVGDGAQESGIYLHGRACDIIAHEYQHGITRFAAGLVYAGDAGAIDEAISDIFGALIEGHAPSEEAFWTVGEDGVPAGAAPLRSIKHPTGNSRATVAEKYHCPYTHRDHNTQCDMGGVHFNSTILSNLQYDMWRQLPDFFTRERIGKLWYATLCTLTENADFDEFSSQLLHAAEALGYDRAAQTAVSDALFMNGLIQDDTRHVVEFEDYDGTPLKACIVAHGEDAVPPEAPVRPSNAQFDFRFTGWSASYEHITKNCMLTALYESIPRLYRVTFEDEAGNLLKEERVRYGEAATPPAPPEKPADAQYEYTFLRWEGVSDPLFIACECTFTPVYAKTVRTYTVTFLKRGGEVLKTERVPWGGSVAPPAYPDAERDERYEYTFAGWDADLDRVTGDLTVSPIFESVPRNYTVTLFDDTMSEERTLHFGDPLPAPTAQSGSRFTGWYLDEALTQCTDGVYRGESSLYAGWARTAHGLPAWAIGVICGGTAAVMGAAVFLTLFTIRKKRSAN